LGESPGAAAATPGQGADGAREGGEDPSPCGRTTPFPFRLRLPVIAAPMFLVSGPALVIAAARAGILGAFPTANCRSAGELEIWLSEISGALGASGAWAVNLVTHSSNRELEAHLALIARYRPPVVITALGSPRPAIEAAADWGGLVLADVVSLPLAEKAIAAGAHGIVCVSAGAGGHTGTLSPFAFAAEVRSRFRGIVALAGGIATGAGVAAAIAAGADLVYVGTRFIAATESLAPPGYKAMVVNAGLEDLCISAAITGTPASWLLPSLAAHGLDRGMLEGAGAGARSYASAAEAARRWRDLWSAGQGVGLVRAVEPVAAIVADLEAEMRKAAGRLEFWVDKSRTVHLCK